MAVDQLTFVLWETREALEDLTFSLEQTLLFAGAGRARHLARATASLQTALARLEAAEQRRVEILAELAPAVGLEPGAPLRAVAKRLDPEERAPLLELRSTLLEQLGTVDRLADQLRQLLAQQLAATSDALALLGASPLLGTPQSAHRPRPRPEAVLVDTRA
jgi:outer membrane protein TolC